jgi:uncharacterized protein YidB (DUF937 family)
MGPNVEGNDMAIFDTLTDDIGARFGLGANAGPLVREALAMVTGSPGGVSGFLNTLKSGGLGSDVASWLGNPNAAPLAPQQIERVVGANALSGIASRLGLGSAIASTAVGYALPKLIGLLTPGGVVPTTLPVEVTNFLSPTMVRRPAATVAAAAAQVAPRRIDVYTTQAVRDEPVMTRWLWPRHCQTKFYTADLGTGTRSSFTVFAHESASRSARFEAENGLYLVALTMPSRAPTWAVLRWAAKARTFESRPASSFQSLREYDMRSLAVGDFAQPRKQIRDGQQRRPGSEQKAADDSARQSGVLLSAWLADRHREHADDHRRRQRRAQRVETRGGVSGRLTRANAGFNDTSPVLKTCYQRSLT